METHKYLSLNRNIGWTYDTSIHLEFYSDLSVPEMVQHFDKHQCLGVWATDDGVNRREPDWVIGREVFPIMGY